MLPRPDIQEKIPGMPEKSESPNLVLQKLAMDVVFCNHGSRAHVYTDGSSYASSSGGAFVVPADGISHNFRLDHKTSSTAAELVAIYKAVKYISTQHARPRTILTDS